MSSQPDYVLPQLAELFPQWELVADCYQGHKAIVSKGVRYLPDPSPVNEDLAVKAQRYTDYQTRAVFYNATRKTAKALSGLVFAKYPTVVLPTELQSLEQDINGNGQTLTQHAKRAFMMALLKGRGGLLADYPVSDGNATKADVQRKGLRPTVTLYEPESIINWRVTTIGNQTKLSLVVIRETYLKSDDGFKAEYGEQLLVLRLTDGKATSQKYQKDGAWQAVTDEAFILDSTGRPFDIIPFTFFGADDNDETIDDAPLYDLAVLNLAHYRDSADYQEGNFIAGQPTLFITGVTTEWYNDVIKNDYPIRLGSRTANILGEGSNAQLLQATTNNANFEAMKHKEQQMASLGAKLLETSTTQKTATQASSENAEETSVLSTIANNISDAYSKCLAWCAMFVGAKGDCVVTLNTNYQTNKMTAQERQQLIAEWQSGAISFKEMRDKLVEDEIATVEDVEQAQAEIEAYSNDSVISALSNNTQVG